MKSPFHRSLLLLAVGLILGLCQSATAQPSAAGGRTLILPFAIHSDQALGFLRQGILDMLSTRLNIPGKSVPIPRTEVADAIASMPGPISQNAAVLLGASLGAAYVVHGSLTVIGSSISTDARFIDVARQQPLVVFSQAGQNTGEVIQHINAFAAQVGAQVFGQQTAPNTGGAIAAAAPGVQTAMPLDGRAHPEKVFNRAMQAGMQPDAAGSDAYGQREGFRPLDIWRSQRFKSHIRGLAVGDVDGDGNNETVFIDKQTVFVYRAIGAAFEKLAELPGDTSDEYISVDVADINGNGRAEIFVSGISDMNWRVKSSVREWDGKAFSALAEGQPYFYRVVAAATRGPVLYGQLQGQDTTFSGRTEQLGWTGAGYEPTVGGVPLPAGIDVYDFAPADIGGDHADMLLAFNRQDILRLLTANGGEEWRSEDPIGGHYVYLEPVAWRKEAQTAKMVNDAESILKRYYLHQRLFIMDIDGDGKKEVLVVNNIDRTGRLLERFRVFKAGHVKCLSWETVGLYEKWRTRGVSGYISDLAVADFDNDGKLELVTPVVSRTDFLTADARSFIMAQELP